MVVLQIKVTFFNGVFQHSILVIIIYFVKGNTLLIAVSYVLYEEARSSMLGFNVVSSMRNKCESHYGIIDFSSLDRSFVVLERS